MLGKVCFPFVYLHSNIQILALPDMKQVLVTGAAQFSCCVCGMIASSTYLLVGKVTGFS
jgi:hypothetical protein